VAGVTGFLAGETRTGALTGETNAGVMTIAGASTANVAGAAGVCTRLLIALSIAGVVRAGLVGTIPITLRL
jgi:hypothetical protein